jgi:hypothetical protein
MRALLLASVACLAIPMPALAQDAEGDARRVADELNDPVRQAQVAAVAEAMAGAMLDLPVAPMLRAAKQIAGEDPDEVDPDLRVGDVVDPEVAEAPREIAAKLPVMMGAMASMTAALEEMLPRLAEIGQRAREAAERRRY